MTEQILGMLQEGASILLQIAVLAGLILLRNLKQKISQYYEAQTTLQQRQLLAQLGQEAFSYAETVHMTEDGPGKMNEALKYMMEKSATSEVGDVSMKDMRAVIESAWLKDRRQSEDKEPRTRLITGEER